MLADQSCDLTSAGLVCEAVGVCVGCDEECERVVEKQCLAAEMLLSCDLSWQDVIVSVACEKVRRSLSRTSHSAERNQHKESADLGKID